MSLSIRPATPADAEAVAAIHNQGIEDRRATFDTTPRAASAIRAAIAAPDGPPFLVAERDGAVAGWARVTPYSDRACYSGVGEASVYVGRGARGQGLGRQLLEALAAASERAGYWKLVALLFPENTASLALFRATGSREVGVYRRHGRLEGEWRDVLLVERLIGDAAV